MPALRQGLRRLPRQGKLIGLRQVVEPVNILEQVRPIPAHRTPPPVPAPRRAIVIPYEGLCNSVL